MLSGQIPDTLGDAKGLETLDLSSNQLSDPIPSDLQNLRALQVLSRSFKNLEGEIPSSGVFAHPSKVHLEGNKNLCLKMRAHRRYLILVFSLIGAIIAVRFTIAFLFCFGKQMAKVEVESESLKQNKII